jgi:hypothetical protein
MLNKCKLLLFKYKQNVLFCLNLFKINNDLFIIYQLIITFLKFQNLSIRIINLIKTKNIVLNIRNLIFLKKELKLINIYIYFY